MPKPQSILLVEDDLNDTELVLRVFKRSNLDGRVVTARHGGEALDYLYRRGEHSGRIGDDPACIFLDLNMPMVDGIEVLQRLKSDEELKVIPIIMLTSSSEERDLAQSYRLGVNAYVVKPVEFAQFFEAIRQLGLFWAVVNVPPPPSAFTEQA
jgi:CheY-like chemotaxis protein